MLFCTRWDIEKGPHGGACHGQNWDTPQMRMLRDGFMEGMKLPSLCLKMGRSVGSIIPKLLQMDLISENEDGDYIYHHRLAKTTQREERKEITMNAKTIETVVMIQGKDAAGLTDDEIFTLIAKLELQMEQLSKVQNKPKKLGKKIEDIAEDIRKLVEYVDSRE